MDERIEQIKKDLQQINQQIVNLKAAAYDRISELEYLLLQKKQAGEAQTSETKEG